MKTLLRLLKVTSMTSSSNLVEKWAHIARVLPPRIVLVTSSLDFMGSITVWSFGRQISIKHQQNKYLRLVLEFLRLCRRSWHLTPPLTGSCWGVCSMRGIRVASMGMLGSSASRSCTDGMERGSIRPSRNSISFISLFSKCDTLNPWKQMFSYF